MWFEPRVGPENCPTRKFLTEYMGAPLCLLREENLNRSERGGDLGGRVWFESPLCRPRKLPYAKVFDETHGGSFVFIEEEGFKPLRPVGDLGEKSVV